MRSLFLIVERERRHLVQIPGQASDDGGDVGIGAGVGLETVPTGYQADWEGRLIVHKLEWLGRDKPGDEPPSAVKLNSWRRYRVGSSLDAILSRVKLSAEGEARIAKTHEC